MIFDIIAGTPSASANNVVLLSSMDGTNGSTAFIDKYGHTMTASGNTQMTTSSYKFGSASGIFDGTGGITMPRSEDWRFNGVDFTVEMWIKITSGSGTKHLISTALNRDQTSFTARVIYQTSTDARLNVSIYPNSWSTTISVPLDQWVFVSFSRNNAGVVYMHINGVYGGSAQYLYSSFADNYCVLGSNASGEYNFIGQMDEVRITKGLGRYSTTGYTPPTAPFPFPE